MEGVDHLVIFRGGVKVNIVTSDLIDSYASVPALVAHICGFGNVNGYLCQVNWCCGEFKVLIVDGVVATLGHLFPNLDGAQGIGVRLPHVRLNRGQLGDGARAV